MKQLALVFLGSGVGGSLRWAISGAIHGWLRTGAGDAASTPWTLVAGTLVVNLTGCFAAGVLGSMLAGAAGMREDARLLVMVGLLGGYTTFSAFGRETILLLEQRRVVEAGVYVVASAVLGIGAAWAGARVSGAVA